MLGGQAGQSFADGKAQWVACLPVGRGPVLQVGYFLEPQWYVLGIITGTA